MPNTKKCKGVRMVVIANLARSFRIGDATVAGSILLATSALAQSSAPPTSAQPALVFAKELSVRPEFLRGDQPEDSPVIRALDAQGRGGRVLLSATVNTDGTLSDFVWEKGSGVAAIDDVVIAALRTWKLRVPRDKSGAAVRTTAKFPFYLGHSPNRLEGSEPAIPEEAKAAGHNGKVGVGARIDSEGRVVDAKIISSSLSPLLDQTALTAVAGYRFEKPLDFAGNPTSLDWSFGFSFSQAEAGGSMISGFRTYRCSAFTSELDWWLQAHPEKKASDFPLNNFLAGISFLMPETLGRKRGPYDQLLAAHQRAWDGAVAGCRTRPDGMVIAEYRRTS